MKFYQSDQYQPRVLKLYEQLASSLLECLPGARIEHIGSSSIQGAISKGDLDVFVGVPKDRFESSLAEIISLGFSIKEGTLRTESLCMLVTTIFNMDVAIQLVENGSAFEDFIRFRDLMNARPDLVQNYNELKIRCTGLGEDDYREIKSKFIEDVLAAAK